MKPELDATQPAAAVDKTLTQAASPRARSVTLELTAGMRLGHFKIERQLGAGGMGEVYLATDTALDRPVAVKVLPSNVTSGDARERLIKEARAQARVHHPNVAHIYFIGEEEGRLYFAMEHIAGKTLADRLAVGPLSIEEALGVIRAAVLGLREAQRQGITHRDVKPSNLMVDAHGVLKVLDFGLAAGSLERASDGPVEQTSFGGTPLYMSPEQAKGAAVDFRTDIYALGATLYHLVSGKPPFVADSVDQLITMHATAARPTLPRGRNPRTMITAIDTLIARMMAPDPADRFASYDELLRALELASVEHTRPAGIVVRSMAMVVDFLIVTIVLGVAATAVTAAWDEGITLESEIIGMIVLAVYSVLALRRWGATAGKALLEVEVVSIATSQRPTWGQAVKRTLALGGVPIFFELLDHALVYFEVLVPNDLPDLLKVVSIAVLVILLLYASLRVPGKRAPWDRFAGTVVRYRTRRGTDVAAS